MNKKYESRDFCCPVPAIPRLVTLRERVQQERNYRSQLLFGPLQLARLSERLFLVPLSILFTPIGWLRELDLNQCPSAYEADALDQAAPSRYKYGQGGVI